MCDACEGVRARDLGWAVNWLTRVAEGGLNVPGATWRALRDHGFVDGRELTDAGRTLLDAHAEDTAARTIVETLDAAEWGDRRQEPGVPAVTLTIEQAAMHATLDGEWRTVDELAAVGVGVARRRPLLVGLRRLGVAERRVVDGEPETWRKAER